MAKGVPDPPAEAGAEGVAEVAEVAAAEVEVEVSLKGLAILMSEPSLHF